MESAVALVDIIIAILVEFLAELKHTPQRDKHSFLMRHESWMLLRFWEAIRFGGTVNAECLVELLQLLSVVAHHMVSVAIDEAIMVIH